MYIMEVTCWICKQKAEYKKEKIIIARQLALKQAIDEKKIFVIWQEGPRYFTGTEEQCGSREILEYISEHSRITTT